MKALLQFSIRGRSRALFCVCTSLFTFAHVIHFLRQSEISKSKLWTCLWEMQCWGGRMWLLMKQRYENQCRPEDPLLQLFKLIPVKMQLSDHNSLFEHSVRDVGRKTNVRHRVWIHLTCFHELTRGDYKRLQVETVTWHELFVVWFLIFFFVLKERFSKLHLFPCHYLECLGQYTQ